MLVMPKNADEVEQKKVISLRWAYCVAVPGSVVGLFFDGLVPRNGNFVLGHAIQFGTLALFFFVTRYRELGFKPSPDIPAETRKKRWILYVMGAVYALHVFFVATAFKFAPIAYVGSMKRIQVIMLILLAWWLLGEKQAKGRLIPGAIVTVGAMLLAFDPSVNVILDAGQKFFGGN
jgi:drug/metabolite transporter (DMT)-like permease